MSVMMVAVTLLHPSVRTVRQPARRAVSRYGLAALLAVLLLSGAVIIRGRFFGISNAHWQRTPLGSETDALLSDPAAPARIFAGTPTGLWISDDAGASWTPAPRWNAKLSVLSLTSAVDHRVIFVGANDGAIYAGDSSGAGRWLRISPALSSSPVFCLAYNPPLHVLLAGTAGGLYRGQQRGVRWEWRKVASTGDAAVTAIVWAPWKVARAYASVFGVAPPLLSTADGGRTWRADARGLPSTLPSQSLLAQTRGGQYVWLSTMGGGVWRRSDDGVWREESNGLPAHHAMPLAANPAGTLYAGTMGYGVYATQGRTVWRRVGRELTGGTYIVLSLALINQQQPVLLAGTSRGVYRHQLPS